MRRLYLQIYLTIVAVLMIVAVVLAILWRGFAAARFEDTAEQISSFVATSLPSDRAPRAAQQRAIEELRRRVGADLALYAVDGSLIAAAGANPPPLRHAHRMGPGVMAGPGGPAWTFRLDDGRWLVTTLPPRRPLAGVITVLAAIGLAIAIGVYPVSRWLTRRLERLQSGVERFGRGDLAARVEVEGKDEIATLARSFNSAAGRIEELLRSHKMLLANASHELRTPLARINLALALMEKEVDPARRGQVKADIAELDQLIEEILLASRLDAIKNPERMEDVDLLALAAEEAARYDVTARGEPVLARGDPVLLRRMIRNLLENALRYGGGSAPDVTVGRAGRNAVLDVRDHGPGIPEAERERVFAPFHRLPGAAETGRGSGLGLALVRQIARSHGGDAEHIAPPNGGSCFRVTLPATPG